MVGLKQLHGPVDVFMHNIGMTCRQMGYSHGTRLSVRKYHVKMSMIRDIAYQKYKRENN